MKLSFIQRSICGVILLSTVTLAAARENCDGARALAEVEAARRAWADSRPDEAFKFLSNSIEECPSYEAYEQIAEYDSIFGAQHGREYYKKAVDAFVDAEALATDNHQKASSLYQYAQLLDTDGQPASAVPLLERAHSLDPQNATVASLQARVENESKHLTRAQAQRALDYPLYKPLKSGASADTPQGGTASSSTAPRTAETVELPFIPIHFVTNSTVADDESRSNLNSLADALADPKRNSSQFLLIGHADQRGSDDYNVSLSLRRAQAISEWLVARQPSLKGRIMVEGHGAHELLDTGTSEHALWVNRRLQVLMKK